MLIVLHGEETYRLSRKLQDFKEKFIKDVDTSRLNLVVIEKSDYKFDKLKQELYAAAFLARKKMIILKNVIDKKVDAELLKLAAAHSEKKEASILIIYNETPLTKDVLKKLGTPTFVFESEFPKSASLNQFIQNEVVKNGGLVDFAEINYLSSRGYESLWQLAHDIEKLCAYANGSKITRVMIDLLTVSLTEDSIFNLVDNFISKKANLSLLGLLNQYEQEANPLYIHTMLLRQVRILLNILSYLSENKGATESEIATTLSLHPFVVKKSLQQSRAYSLDQLKNLFNELVILDTELKKKSVPPELSLEYLVITQKSL